MAQISGIIAGLIEYTVLQDIIHCCAYCFDGTVPGASYQSPAFNYKNHVNRYSNVKLKMVRYRFMLKTAKQREAKGAKN